MHFLQVSQINTDKYLEISNRSKLGQTIFKLEQRVELEQLRKKKKKKKVHLKRKSFHPTNHAVQHILKYQNT